MHSHLSRIKCRCIIRINKEYILRLEIGVRQLVVVQELYSIAELIRDMSHMIHRIWLVVVVLEKVKNT